MIIKQINSGVVSPIVTTVEGYDPDAKDWFNRVESAGGSFDLTGTVSGYTGLYTKTTWSDAISVMKGRSDGGVLGSYPYTGLNLWNKAVELYPIAGLTFGGILQKLKYTTNPIITNVDFASGDYVPAGANAGLTDGSGKRLNLNFETDAVSEISMIMSLQTHTNTSNGRLMGRYQAGGNELRFYSNAAQAVLFKGRTTSALSGTGPGIWIGTTKANEQELYKNGSNVDSGTEAAGGLESGTSWGLGILGLTGDTTMRQSFEGYAQHLSVTEAAALSWILNAVATRFGFNTYSN